MLSLCLAFLAFFVLMIGSMLGNDMINGGDSTFVLVGFATYLVIGLVEILISRFAYSLWKNQK
jgi:hypothetical protein